MFHWREDSRFVGETFFLLEMAVKVQLFVLVMMMLTCPVVNGKCGGK